MRKKRHKIKLRDRERYIYLCEQMQYLLDDISEYCPKVNIYVEDAGNWNLMVGESHNDRGTAQFDNSEEMCLVVPSGGGGW